MSDIPFESHLRDMINRIYKELTEINQEPIQTDDQRESLAVWEHCLTKLISECLIAMERNIDYRRAFNKN